MKIEKIKTALGEPYYENEFGLIYNMDCIEGLKKLNEIKIDLTTTSPPYNIGKEYEKVMDLDKFIKWLSEIGELIYNSTKSDGAFLFNVGYLEVQNKGRALPNP